MTKEGSATHVNPKRPMAPERPIALRDAFSESRGPVVKEPESPSIRRDVTASARRGRGILGRIPQKGVVASAIAILLLPRVFGEGILPSMILAGILGIAAVGLGLLAGRAGLVSLGQAGLAAVGGYGAAYAAVRWDWPAEAALLFGMLAGLVTAWLTSPICRLRGFYLATATLTFAVIVQRLLVALTSVTGGANGFPGIPTLTLFGLEFSSEFRFYVLVWGIALTGVALNANMLHARFGRALDTIHADEATAAAAGINVGRHKSAAWIISGGYAALGGGLYAYYNLFLSPDQFPISMSIELIAGVVVGGASAPLGPLVGVVALVVVPRHLDLGRGVTTMLAPALLVVFACFFPRGIVPHVRDLSERLVSKAGR